VAPGFLAFVRDGHLMVQRLDARNLRLSGPAVTVAKSVAFNPRQWTGAFSFSSGGLLVFQTGTPAPKSRLTWLSLDGKQAQPIGAPQEFGAVAVSPDARRAVAQIADGPGRFLLWLYELRQGASLRFTSGTRSSTGALWSPDGKQVVYGDGVGNLFVQPTKGVKPARQLLSEPEPVVPTGWSHDGHLLAYQEHGKNGWDVWILPMSGDRKPYSFLATAFNETTGTFSPDGHWFSYLSDESGRNELYAVPFPAGGTEQKISTDGARAGGWVPGLPELAYVTPKGQLVIVKADTRGAKLTLQKPEVALAGRRLTGAALPAGAPTFFAADGKRILFPVPVEKSISTTLTLVTNWTTGLKQK
jgi:Tol biopolymer transport system component